jgi:hypothetical protein
MLAEDQQGSAAMSVTTAYLNTVGDVPKMFEAIQKAQVPPRFTHAFLQSLGFKSTYDRAFVNVLKGLGFLDQNAAPTDIYRAYRDKGQSKKLLGQQIRKAYPDLFMADENVHEATVEDIKGKLASITGKDAAVVAKMASTFKSIAAMADFSGPPKATAKPLTADDAVESPALERRQNGMGFAFSHTIYINLPTTRDAAVYDAIFRSIREHLS